MTEAAPTTASQALGLPALDVLELVRNGVLARFPESAPDGCIDMGALGLTPLDGTAVNLLDQEGVAVARLGAGTDADTATTARPEWLDRRSTRPFERWHRAPHELSGHSGVVVIEGTVAEPELRQALIEAGNRPLLLLLGSLDGDVASQLLDAARQGVAAEAELPGSQFVVVPLPSVLTSRDRERVVAAYAARRPVHELLPQPSTNPAGTVLFFTGLSGAGKSTLARAVRNRLVEQGRRVTLLDGDLVRRHLSAGLGFSAADRETNIRRIGWVAAEVAHHGGTVICSPIAPLESTRQDAAEMVRARGGRFVLVHVSTPLAECERRDRKGLYARARSGQVPEFTGISSPYEAPTAPDLALDTTDRDLATLTDVVLELLDGSAP